MSASEEDFIELFPLAYKQMREAALREYNLDLSSMFWAGITESTKTTIKNGFGRLSSLSGHFITIHYDNGDNEVTFTFQTDTPGATKTEEIVLKLVSYQILNLENTNETPD